MWLSKDSQRFPSVLFSSYSLMESKTLFIGKYSIFHISINQFVTHIFTTATKNHRWKQDKLNKNWYSYWLNSTYMISILLFFSVDKKIKKQNKIRNGN